MTATPPAWAGSVDVDTLVRLLALQSEHDWLDYKQQCDLSSQRDEVEIAKDVGAMMTTGGYIVVGADDRGQPAGDVKHLELFDPATLHAKLAKYIPKPFDIRAASHAHQGQDYAVVYVAPHPDGLCIFERDGTYWDGTKQVVVFRRGDVFARHGTKSERWEQQDVALVKQRLRVGAERAWDQGAEALQLLRSLPGHLGGKGIWLAVAVVPEYPVTDPPMISPAATQQFMHSWHLAEQPIESLALDTATYRQPGGVVISSQAGVAATPWWWQFVLFDAGAAVGVHVVEQEPATVTDDGRWQGLPQQILDGRTIAARRDLVEIHLLTVLDLASAHCASAGAGGLATLTAGLLAPSSAAWQYVAVVNEVLDRDEKRQGWRLASARAHQPRASAETPVTHSVRLSDTRDPELRVRAAHRLAAELLALFGLEEPGLLKADGRIDPYGAATDQQQLAYQHARHLELPVDQVSPAERRQRYEEQIKAARDQLHRR